MPKESSPAMQVRLAQNEREAAQFVLHPAESLQNLQVTSQALHSESGATLVAAAVEVLRVAYVPVTQPTDAVGVAAPWPDPLPPLAGSMDLAANENQPFWVCVHTSADTPAGMYRGVIVLEADGWKASVPLEVEVFDFVLPDRKTCTSAFGFDAGLAFRYHNATSEVDRRKVYESYLSILSNHHISIYNPAVLDPIQYDWPHLPKWQGGENDSKEKKDGTTSLLLHDESATENVATLYDELFSIPEEGLNIQFDYKTDTPGHEFLITILHYDVSGGWMHGRNNDIAVKGNGSWQHFSQKINTFPEGATQFMLRFWATRYSEEGTATGSVWLDNVEVRNAPSSAVMIQDDFEAPDAKLAEIFTPEFDWTAWDAAMTRAFDQYHVNGF